MSSGNWSRQGRPAGSAPLDVFDHNAKLIVDNCLFCQAVGPAGTLNGQSGVHFDITLPHEALSHFLVLAYFGHPRFQNRPLRIKTGQYLYLRL